MNTLHLQTLDRDGDPLWDEPITVETGLQSLQDIQRWSPTWIDPCSVLFPTGGYSLVPEYPWDNPDVLVWVMAVDQHGHLLGESEFLSVYLSDYTEDTYGDLCPCSLMDHV